jgi:hypothetical protein
MVTNFSFSIFSSNNFIALCIGVFDLNAPVYRCNKRNTCNYNREVRLKDFIFSGYFPGNPNNLRLLFSTKLLKMWHHVSLLTPRTSLTQFSNALANTSQDAGLVRYFTSNFYYFASLIVTINACIRQIEIQKCLSHLISLLIYLKNRNKNFKFIPAVKEETYYGYGYLNMVYI